MPVTFNKPKPVKSKGEAPAPTLPAITVVTKAVDALEPYPNNPRKNDEAVPHMVSLIEKFGFRQPILVRGQRIVDGHLRIKAAKKLGMETVPAIEVGALTETEERALRIAMNKSVEWAEWDHEALAIEFDAISTDGFDLHFTGFDTDVVDKILNEVSTESEAVTKTLDGDKGTKADPNYVSITFHMTVEKRNALRAKLDKTMGDKGLDNRSQALLHLAGV